MGKATRVSRHVPIIGFRRDGRPMYLIAGGDGTSDQSTLLSADQLRALDPQALAAERTRMLELLDDSTHDVSQEELDYADAIGAEVVRRNDASNAAAERRARLAGVELAGGSDDPPGPRPRPAGDQRVHPRGGDGAAAPVSLGVAFTRTRAFRDYRERGASGQVAIDIPGFDMSTRAVVDTSAGSGGAFQNPDRTPAPPVTRDRPLWIADLIDRRPTGTNAIEYVQENVFTNAAAETAEGGAKPEATITFAVVSDTTRTIAHYLNITRQAADDDLQLIGYIEGRLTYGLERRLNDQIIGGNGTAPNLRGVLNTAGIGTYTAGTAAEAGVISIRKAITVAQLSEFAPDTVALNPVDWEAVELSTDNQGTFRVTSNPANPLTPRIWGLNVVVTNGITGTVFGTTGGTFLVGNFREGATLWERQGIRILMTDSHASNFTSNILTLLAELRAGLSVWRPAAFVKGTFGASRT